MPKKLLIFATLVFSMVIVSIVSAAVLVNTIVTFEAGDLEIQDSYPLNNCIVSAPFTTRSYAEIINFTPTVTDTYTITGTFTDNDGATGGLIAVYSPTFVAGSAGTNCVDSFFSSTSVVTLSLTLNAGQDYQIVTTLNQFSNSDEEGSATIIIEDSTQVSTEEDEESPPAFIPLDERLNRFDSAAPIAVYVNAEGGVDIYSVTDGSTGVFALQVTDLESATCDGSQIATDGVISIYRTSDCIFQINAPQYNGKTYVLRFETVSADAEYISYEE